MARDLLSLALTVDRHGEGDYFWVILESFDRSGEFSPLLEAASVFPSYIGALRASYAVLISLVDDVFPGPLDDSAGEQFEFERQAGSLQPAESLNGCSQTSAARAGAMARNRSSRHRSAASSSS